MSGTSLHLLLIEDSEDDAALLLRELRRAGYAVTHTRVQTAEELERALGEGTWDIIISDYSLPRFDGLAAFAQVQKRGLDVPFLIVSGAIGEDTAVAAMKAGVHDFLLKDRLARLAPAVARELREAQVRADRRRMQEQLMLSERLSSLGMLAASVAHEINNPLASLMMNLSFAQELLRGEVPPEEGLQVLREAVECSQRIRDIVQDIKVFSRPDEQDSGPTDLHRVLDSSLRMARNHVVHRAQLVTDYAQDVPRVQGSEARLGQIFLNLIINAAQAIPEGHRDEHEIRVVTSREPTGGVRVEIRDTGVGIPESLHERIFEPFFTTKPEGVGTGLGLSICRRLITQMGGSIRVESKLGRGTTFQLHLQEAAAVARVSSRRAARPKSGLHVLVVDDDVPVAKAIKRNLSRRYEVIALDRARAALELIASGQRFDAILCDLMMPEMTGPQFHEELQRLAPEQALRVTFMTGGAFTSEARAFLATTPNPCVEKPLDMERLFPLLEAAPQR
ncbi:hybrid sensor histidine kinase/response regulator [Hyalangium minutum]|uniref:histidine kinase n=1 Tax=Hyalangium minutum TaxID=394096 RepID=A0A085WR18_9BACT|nr:response regulator [Hyalangium minutum]KFE70131.1 Sensory box histidine kinase [Hyalangium minutum]